MAHILRRYSLQIKGRQSLVKIAYRQFSDQQQFKEEEKVTTPPPMFDYQAPKDDDSYRNYESTYQFIRRYLIILPIAAICLYDMLLVRRNSFSNNREYKFINKPAESIIGSVISRKLLKEYRNLIYKQDTEEVQLVKKVLNKLIQANGIEGSFIPSQEEGKCPVVVTLIQNDTLIMFLNMDQHLFLTIKALKVSQMKEEELALLISHELSHYMLEHQFHRLVKSLFVNKILSRLITSNTGMQEVYDPARVEFKTKVLDKQKYSCFYPQQRVMTKFYEKNCDIFAMQLWKKAYPDADQELCVKNVYGNIQQHLDSLAYIDQNEHYNSTYTYKRLDVNLKLVNSKVETTLIN